MRPRSVLTVTGSPSAAPIWAAIVARLNERQRQRGRGRIGFAQPLLYGLAGYGDPLSAASGGALRPVTEGATDMIVPARDAQGAAIHCRVDGFVATTAWNPAVGLGVPDVAALRRALDGGM